MSEETKTFWITKYALTQGIFTIQGRVVGSPDGEAKYATGGGERYWIFCRIGTEAFETEAEATANAIDRARKKCKSLDKSRAKIIKTMNEWIAKVLRHGDSHA